MRFGRLFRDAVLILLLAAALAVSAAADEPVPAAPPAFAAGVDAVKSKNTDLAIEKFRAAIDADAKFLPSYTNLAALLLPRLLSPHSSIHSFPLNLKKNMKKITWIYLAMILASLMVMQLELLMTRLRILRLKK